MAFKYRNLASFLASLFLVLFAPSSSAEIYQQIMPTGTIKYNDKPTNSSTLIKLKDINIYSSGKNLILEPSVHRNEVKPYAKIIIQSPQQAQTFYNSLSIPVQLTTSPELNSKDLIEIWLDGNLYQRGQDTYSTLQNIERGEHHLQIKITTADGKMLSASELVTFYVHQKSAGELRLE